MQLRIANDEQGAATLAADWLAARIESDVTARGRSVIALSGGQTPWPMLVELMRRDLPWHALHVVQVDERIVPAGDARRNLVQLREILVKRGPLPAEQLHGMPVDRLDAMAAERAYERKLASLAGSPPRLDVVQLGLGTDGHTASLFPGDPVLSVDDRDVSVTGMHAGTPRMTLTLPAINRARARLWLVLGAEKAARLKELVAGGCAAPACRVTHDDTWVVADSASSASLNPTGSPAK